MNINILGLEVFFYLKIDKQLQNMKFGRGKFGAICAIKTSATGGKIVMNLNTYVIHIFARTGES